MAKYKERFNARRLRQQGESIGNISKIVKVSKSSVSLWCRDIVLTRAQEQRLVEKDKQAGAVGRAMARKSKIKERIDRLGRYADLGNKSIKNLDNRELLLVGAALYWAEGDKKNRRVTFTNSDPKMVNLIIAWLKDCLNIRTEDIYCYVGINEAHLGRINEVEEYWSRTIGIDRDRFSKASFKKVKLKKVYENFNEHFGTLNVRVRKSTNLNYFILGLIEGLKQFEPN